MKSIKLSVAHYLGLGSVVAALLQPMLVQAQAVPVISCSTDPAIFNTGIDGSNGYSINSPKLPIGTSLDAHWSIAPAFSDITTPNAAGALSYAQGPVDRPGAGNGAWVQSPFGNAEWIGVQYGQDYYVYKYQFTMDPAVDTDSFNLSLNLYVDNQVKRIFVNDTQFDYTNGGASAGVGGFGSSDNVPVLLNDGWKTGTNTIYVVVGNQADPSGLLVQSSGTASCSPPLSVAKQAVNSNGSAYTGLAVANGDVFYDITVTNASNRDASGTRLQDTLPNGLQTAGSTWICRVPLGSAALCPAPNNGIFPLDTILPTLPAGSSLVFRIASRFSSPLPAGATVITNTATIEPPATSSLSCDPRDGFPSPCSASASIATSPLLSVSKTVDATQALNPGQTATYTVTVKNEGSAELNGVVLTDTLPTGFASATWSCQSPVGSQAVCPQASGSLAQGGVLNQTIASMRANASLVYTVVATVDSITTRMDQVSNTATVTASNDEWLCYNPATAQTQAKPCSASVAVDLWPNPMLQLSKSVDAPGALQPGSAMVYTITVRNAGAVPIAQALLTDPAPANVVLGAWTCTGSGATCPAATGSGPLSETLSNLPAGASLSYVIQAQIAASAPRSGSLTNQANLSSSDSGAQCLGGSALPCTASATVITTAAEVPGNPTPVPSLQTWSVLLLGLLTAGLGAWRISARRQRV